MSMIGIPKCPPFPEPERAPVKIIQLVKGEGFLLWALAEDGRVFRNDGDGEFREASFRDKL